MSPLILALTRAALLLIVLVGLSAAVPRDLGAQCEPWDPHCGGGGDNEPPQVTITPASGTFGSASKTITVEWCDNMSLTAHAISLNGVDKTASFNYVPGTRSGCGAFATSTGTVALTMGPNTLEATIADNNNNVGGATANYTLQNGYMTIDGAFNNNDRQVAGLCDAGCFAATYAQSTVPYFSASAPRSVTLVYHGDRAFPMPFVYVDVTAYTDDVPTIQEFWLRARVNGVFLPFRNGDTTLHFSPSQPVRRFAGQLDVRHLATGTYPLDLILTTVFASGSPEEKTLSTKLLVVNDSASSIARGWAIAGIQRLYPDGSSVLITDGDGSAVYFASCGSNCFVKPKGEFSSLSYNSTTYTRSYLDSTKVTFNAQGQMTQVIDRFGNTVTLSYDGSGRLSKIEDPYRTYSGGTLRSYINLVYGTYGLSRIEEPGADGTPSTGRVTTVTVNASRHLTAITDPDNVSTSFGYDASGRLSTVTDRRGSVSTFGYDAQSWKLAQLTAPQVAVDAGNGSTQLATPTTVFRAWQIVGVPTAPTAYPSALATPLHPDSTVGRVTDAEGRATSFRVDRWGQPVKVWDPAGRTTTIARNADGLPTAITSPSGAVDSLKYQVGGSPLVTWIRPAGQNPTQIRYGVAAQPDSIYGAGLRWQRLFLHTPTGRVDSIRIQGVDSAIKYTYDARHRVIEVKDQNQHRWIYRYDVRTGNLDSAHSAPSNHFAVTRFDGAGRDSVSLAEGQIMGRVIYDVLNRPRELYEGTQPNPAIVTYDALFRTQVEDRKGQLYKYQYNALGWLTREEDPTTAAMTYRHDRTGLVTSWTNRRGQVIDYRYDGIGRLVSKRGVNVAPDSFAYSSDDRKVVAISTYSLDSLFLNTYGQTDSIATWLNGKRYRRQYRWNGNGAIDSVGVATTSAIVFAQRRYVQPTGLLDTLRVAGQAIRFAYNKEFQRTSTVFPFSGGTVTRSEYYTTLHQRYRTSFSNTGIDDALWRNYIRDERGRIVQEDRKASLDAKARVFGYNDRGHLARVELATNASGIECPPPTGGEIINDGEECAPTSTWTVDAVYRFAYDSAGNLREQLDSIPNVTTTGVYANGNRISSWGGATHGHDADGNRTSKTSGGVTTLYSWSADGRLTSVSSGSTTLRYDYNAFGQPVRRTRNWAEDRYFLWDGDHLMAELDASSQRVAEYVYAPGIDNPVALVTGPTSIAATRYFEEDELGNVIGVFQSGMWQTLRYDVRGKLEAITGTLADTNRLRWKGLVWEGDVAQVYYVRNRWYDPETGRFLIEDPIGLEGGLNFYMFARNDHVNGRDPRGLEPLCPDGYYDSYYTIEVDLGGGEKVEIDIPTCVKNSPPIVTEDNWNYTRPSYDDMAQRAIEFSNLLRRLGTRYKLGDGTDFTDCSHFVCRFQNANGRRVPYLTTAQIPNHPCYVNVSPASAQAGDVLWVPGHVGIYLGTRDSKGRWEGVDWGQRMTTNPRGALTVSKWGPGGWFTGPTRFFRPVC